MLCEDPHFPNLRVLSLDDGSDRARLEAILSGGYGLHNGLRELDAPPPVDVLSTPLGSYLFKMISIGNPRSIGARTCIVEAEYVDHDLATTYARLHSRTFKDHRRRTVRLHFFETPVGTKEGDKPTKPETCTQFLETNQLRDDYRGFVVLSSSGPRTLGRSILPPPRGDNYWHFVPGQFTHTVNLAGLNLEVTGTPYIQQDGRISACASAAAWMSAATLARRYDYSVPLMSMAEITDLARKYTIQPGGRRNAGLTPTQLLWAFHEMGYEPILHAADGSEEEIGEVIYQAVESGIPPILILRLPRCKSERNARHAVVAFGHAFDGSLDPSIQARTTNRRTASAWSPFFLVHDDQKGPYLKLSFEKQHSEEFPRVVVHSKGDPLLSPYRDALINEWYDHAYLESVVVPLPPRHPLSSSVAERKANHALSWALGEMLRRGYPIKKLRAELLSRVYLTRSNDWKASMVPAGHKGGRADLTEELAWYYRGLTLPRYVWVAEFYDCAPLPDKDVGQLRIVAEVLIDPTSHFDEVDFLLVHVPGWLIRNQPWHRDPIETMNSCSALLQLGDDKPYQPLIRRDFAREPIL